MNFLLLHQDSACRLLATGGIVPAADVPTVQDAAALLAEARSMRDSMAAAADAAREQARAAGHADGLAAGRAVAEAEAGARLFQLELAAAEARAADRARIADMALAVVRRIAGELGESAMVAAIAERATADLAPDARAVVRVPPHALHRARAIVPPPFTVEADPALGRTDCIVETPLGRTIAGLDTQLAAIARAWAAASPPTRQAQADAA